MNDKVKNSSQVPTTVMETSLPGFSGKKDVPEPYLEILSGIDSGKHFKLSRQRTVIGRSPEADIVLSDSKISRIHGALLIEADGIAFEDFGSSNGTYVNESRITKCCLNELSRIRIGHTEMKVDFKKSEEADREASLYAAANTDSLTQLANRRAFLASAEQELSLCKRKNDSIAIVMADVDHFKQKNDTYGHPAGDYVLKEIARILMENVRQSDIAARYGGEEFIVLLRGTVPELACAWAERLRNAVEHYRFNYNDSFIPTTVSMGVCSMQGRNVDDLHLLIKMADDALYEAKKNGRNRVEVA